MECNEGLHIIAHEFLAPTGDIGSYQYENLDYKPDKELEKKYIEQVEMRKIKKNIHVKVNELICNDFCQVVKFNKNHHKFLCSFY